MTKNVYVKNAVSAIKMRDGLTTQKEISDKLGSNPSHLSEVINGSVPLTKQLIYKFQTIFGVNPKYLQSGEGDIFIEGGVKVGNYSPTQIGNSNKMETSADLSKALDEIAEQRKLVTKAQEQIDRLLNIIEKQTK